MTNKKQFSYLRLILLIIYFGSVHLSGLSQEIIALTYEDTFTNSSNQNFNSPILPKHQRVSSKSSSIIINEGQDFDNEQLQKVVDYVASVWKTYILNSRDLTINVEWADIDSDIETTVQYIHKNNIAYPLALNTYLENLNFNGKSYPDGIIKINRNTNWDFGLGDNISSDTKNLAFGLMRAFARIMGFGSDVRIDNENKYSFIDKRLHTIFNTLVSNSSGRKLTSIDPNNGKTNTELKLYAEEANQTFWVKLKNNAYKLASGPYSKDNPPFVFLEDKNSLMRKNVGVGEYLLSIDSSTEEILNELGWNTQTPLVEIVSDDVPVTGLASAYEEHTFKINKNNLKISHPQWTLKLPLSIGGYQDFQLMDQNFTCTTPALTNTDIYKRNSDGDIEALLELKYDLNGNTAHTLPFRIYFELAPYIEYASIEWIEDESPARAYSAHYKVKYKGAEKIYVYVEEEFGSDVRSTCIREPYIATGCAKHVKSPYYAWIDFEVENNYGKATYTIELQPYGVVSHTPTNLPNINNSKRNHKAISKTINTCKNIDVFDSKGNFIVQVKDLSEIQTIKVSGPLIIRQTLKDGTTNTLKILKNEL